MNKPNAKGRILETALRIFAEKSFEGARIDEIAKEANVPKSLIYYHFKSKDEILEVLIEQFIQKYLELIDEATKESNEEKVEGLTNRIKTVYYEFGKNNADLIRVIFIYSLKKSVEKPILFVVLEAMIQKEREHKRLENYNIQERRIAEFFTSFIPSFAFICFGDAWTKYFNIDKREFNQLFLKVYMETHGAYHNNMSSFIKEDVNETGNHSD